MPATLSANNDLKSKKELAKLGMATSLGFLVASSLSRNNDTMKNMQIGAGLAFAGFSFWHLMLNKNPAIKIVSKQNSKKAIQLNNFFAEIALNGKLSNEQSQGLISSIDKILKNYDVQAVNILLDIRKMEGFEIKTVWKNFLFAKNHIQRFKKIAVIGNKAYIKLLLNTANKVIHTDIAYFSHHKKAKQWLLS